MSDLSYKWVVTSVTTFPTLDVNANVAHSVDIDLRVIGDVLAEPIVVYRTVAFLSPPATNQTFVPFDQLDETQVIAWALDSIGDQEVKRQIAVAEATIRYQLGVVPKIVTNLPWSTEDPIAAVDATVNLTPILQPSTWKPGDPVGLPSQPPTLK